MTVEQLESQVLALPVAERRQFLNWLDDHRHEILPEDNNVSDAMRREIIRRGVELRDNPSLAETVDDQYFDRIKRRVADALARKASAV